MKNKMITVVIVIVAVIALILVGWYVMFMHWGIGPAFPFMKGEVVEFELPEVGVSETAVSETAPLMALVESEEAAKDLAEQYGITFVSFQNGVATYYTDEDLQQVISRGEENGYTPLYINQARKMYDS